MSDFGIKVSLPGIDVKTATPEQCAIHSSYPSPKVRVNANPGHSGVVSVFHGTEPAAVEQRQNLLTVPHGLGFVPMTLGIWERIFGSATKYGTMPLSIDVFGQYRYEFYADITNAYVDFVIGSGPFITTMLGTAARIRYFIFAEDGA